MQKFILLFSLITASLIEGKDYKGECENETPEFSHLKGSPDISPVIGENGVTEVIISWNDEQIIFAEECADAFEVEHQQVGGGRMKWSEWSAMVGCAPYTLEEGVKHFSCNRRIQREMCARRVRFRVVAHNSRRKGGVKVVPSPYQETLISCNRAGAVVSVQTGVLTDGGDNRLLTEIEKHHMQMVARSRDRVLIDRNDRRRRLIEFRRTSSTSTTTTTTTTTTVTTTITTRTSTTSTSPAIDPTLHDDQYIPDYYDYYDEAGSDDIVDMKIIKPVDDDRAGGDNTPIQCSYSSWSPWSVCTRDCGSGMTHRSRKVITGVDQMCSYTNQTKSCFGTSCPNKVHRGDKVYFLSL